MPSLQQFQATDPVDTIHGALLEDGGVMVVGASASGTQIAEEIQRSVDLIRDEGWALYLVVDKKREDETPEDYARRVLGENADFQNRPVPLRLRRPPRSNKNW